MAAQCSSTSVKQERGRKMLGMLARRLPEDSEGGGAAPLGRAFGYFSPDRKVTHDALVSGILAHEK
ncbi:hypothetical protein V6615_10050 [Oscillospiraceae bacterium PP1C4]